MCIWYVLQGVVYVFTHVGPMKYTILRNVTSRLEQSECKKK